MTLPKSIVVHYLRSVNQFESDIRRKYQVKKIMAFILALTLTASLAACGGGGATSDESGQSNNEGSGNVPSAAEISLSGEIGGEITISAYDTLQYKTFLEDAARLFEEKYPGTTVNVETFSAMPEIKTSEPGDQMMVMVDMQDDPQGRQDYINKVNTALMSGEGADILLMDVLPVYKYADSGQLENLGAYMDADPDFNRTNYQENILDATRYNGGTWFMPMDYTFDYYAYDTTLLPGASAFGTGSAFTVEQLMDLAESSFDGSTKLFNIPDYTKRTGGMWGNLLAENYTSFVDLEYKQANFNDGRFAALLESVKEYGERGYIPQGTTGQADPGAMMQGAGEDATDRFFFKPKNVSSLIALFTRDLGMKMSAMAEGDTMAIGDNDEIAGIAAAADGSVPFDYEQAYAINAHSQNKETAWAFLKFLLSEEMQLSSNLRPTSLPMLNSAREKKMVTMLTSMLGQQGQSLNEAQLEAIAKYNEAVEQLSDQINSYRIEDIIVNDMIAAEVSYFFDGTKTAEEVADVLQNKVDLYLNE
jgi:multiple sugar transport system substrate-binding protein